MTYDAFAARRERLRARLADAGLDALLVTSLVGVRHLTGFTGSNGAVLVTEDDVWFATDGRYTEQAARETGLADVTVTRGVGAALVRRAADAQLGVVGVEAAAVTLAQFDALAEAAGDSVRLVARRDDVESVRAVKDPVEQAALRHAAALADEALRLVAPGIVPGDTERAVADRLEEAMRRLGAEAPAFPTIVAAGPNGAEPHHRPSSYGIRSGDLVTIDWGARVDGYHSDATRTIAVGGAGDLQPWQREVVDAVSRAQQAGVAAVRAGVVTGDVDAAARATLAAAGHGAHFVHGTGHGVGLEIHEAPMLLEGSDGALQAGMVVTVEPGVYLPGRGGVRIEDMLLVTGDGAEVLTLAPRGLDASAW